MSFNEAGDYKAIVEFIEDHPGRTGRQIAGALGLKPSRVNSILLKLERDGTLYTSKDDGAKARFYVSGRSIQ